MSSRTQGECQREEAETFFDNAAAAGGKVVQADINIRLSLSAAKQTKEPPASESHRKDDEQNDNGDSKRIFRTFSDLEEQRE